MARKGQRHLSVYVPEELYQRLKEVTEKRYMTITKYVLCALLELLSQEDIYK